MKIATYNMRSGGSPRVHWSKMIDEEGVDLLLAQESAFPDEHLPPLLYPDAKLKHAWEMVGRNGWGSAIFSKTGLVEKIAVSGFEGWVVGAKITHAEWQKEMIDDLLIFSLHAPSVNESYSKQVNKILDVIVSIAQGRDVILGGDFNLTVSHRPDSARPTAKQDLLIQNRLGDELGLINCWCIANPDVPLSQTLRWSKDKTIPYHCDGMFVPRSWQQRLMSCSVLSGEKWNRLSDHNPVVAEFAYHS
jgi:endonuclease/exonuclease/phosphatase family metal-dependent hydrolase